ncbi:helix-turn-helix domain-containing protein [Streptomyces sp. NPDC087226]|uniref:helix-turn-helix domain-containing protein n=1 Tax=Streptomyces sp. NPDC087226 TaxID=3365771 RepID=UPI003821DE85
MPVASACPIVLTAAERERLKKLAYGHNTEHRLRCRAQIVLHAARGRSNARTAHETGLHLDTVRAWRGRFAHGGLSALEDWDPHWWSRCPGWRLPPVVDDADCRIEDEERPTGPARALSAAPPFGVGRRTGRSQARDDHTVPAQLAQVVLVGGEDRDRPRLSQSDGGLTSSSGSANMTAFSARTRPRRSCRPADTAPYPSGRPGW